jgi:hypothetical protein
VTPADYVNEIVVPTVREFRDDRRSRRHAYLACIVTFHVRDHLKKAGEQHPDKLMEAACKDEWKVVRAVCNGTKHVTSEPFRVGQDWDVPQAMLGVFQLGVSYIGDAVGGREVALGVGSRDIYACVKRVLVSFRDKFPAHLGGCNLSDC